MKFVYIIIPILLSLLVACSTEDNASPSPLVYPDAESPGAKLYVEKCSGCHAAPLPGIHVSSHWPGIVQRMQQRMTAKAIQPLNKTDVAIIVDYLQKHARDKSKNK